jgi:hypothetical protein
VTTRLFAIPLLAALALYGQRGGYDTRRAEIRGGGGDGKCTIEVEVDGVAEVEIIGDTARLRTLAGQPAMWRRFVCNQPMPRNPYGFRFQGIDGRGRQELVRDPGNGGAAVVRIEDRRGGREGYTFDIEWRGGGGGGRGDQGSWGGGRGPGSRPDRTGRYWDERERMWRVEGDGACFYQAPGFRGEAFCTRVGADLRSLPPGFRNNISSVRFFGRVRGVEVFNGSDFRGSRARLAEDQPDLRRARVGWSTENINNQIESLRVY